MNISKQQRLSIGEVKEIDMVNYLSRLGFEPAKIRSVDYWYLSPLRNENTPSFKINRKLNRWYDHGIGKGGNLIDFAILFNDCTVGEFLQKVNDESFIFRSIPDSFIQYKPEPKISILKEEPICSFALLRYLKERRISIDIAAKFCREVRYGLNQKEYYGIGFKNDGGGYEIRTPYFKTSSSPKGITTIQNNAQQVIVFEGFFDFLSFMSLHKDQDPTDIDFVILNSVSFFEKARLFMEKHLSVRLYLDRDETGNKFSKYALSISSKYTDESRLYKHHKDLNNWLINFGKCTSQNLPI
ncbi:MAG: toprim domain-containing protein [Ginsengibacter sp.]